MVELCQINALLVSGFNIKCLDPLSVTMCPNNMVHSFVNNHFSNFAQSSFSLASAGRSCVFLGFSNFAQMFPARVRSMQNYIEKCCQDTDDKLVHMLAHFDTFVLTLLCCSLTLSILGTIIIMSLVQFINIQILLVPPSAPRTLMFLT